MSPGNVIVYAGAGSSHSWTWLADLFESKGVINVRFLDSTEFIDSLPGRPAVAIISGGDGFEIGSSLSGQGFVKLEEYISRGGTYVGVCAGAYLPLPSSIDPFSQFNISTTRVENIDCMISPLEGIPPRVAVKYGRCAIVHPVRGEIDLDQDGSVLKAPIYGGPIFKEPDKDSVILRCRDFTPNTEFQFGERFAKEIVLGHPAAIRCLHGDGELLLFGPHLEHPSYPEANHLFLDLLRLDRSRAPKVDAKPPRPDLAIAIADLKVAIVGLENRSFIVGRKLWDGSRYMELVHAIEKRTWSTDDRLSQEFVRDLETVRGDIVRVNIGVESEVDQTTQLLVECARRCVDNHFRRLVESR
ncbi:MAG: BPL-N domain-containing protein [Thermoplasmatota archaeon]|nr:hypothetical protein [Candidatus Thermoplasmatota archaeon]MBU1915100.1 hypothetical protein [Candidatus Thermoplasmatota archaeon]